MSGTGTQNWDKIFMLVLIYNMVWIFKQCNSIGTWKAFGISKSLLFDQFAFDWYSVAHQQKKAVNKTIA